MRNIVRTLLTTALMTSLPLQGSAEESDCPPPCYDTLVSAEIVNQVPSIIPDDPDGGIVMRWPWFVDLRVRRVIEGEVDAKLLTVLSVQHTDYRAGLRAKRWWLRRNTLGAYNAVGFSGDERVAKCAANAAPAEPYYRPADGKTLADVRREAAAFWGRDDEPRNPNAR